MENSSKEIREPGQLVSAIEAANTYFLGQVQKQVNTALTLRNWVIGRYIIEYEQKGEDRAQYGQQLFKEISETLRKIGLRSFGERNLYLCKSQKVFVSKYLINLPGEEQLKEIIEREQEKIQK